MINQIDDLYGDIVGIYEIVGAGIIETQLITKLNLRGQRTLSLYILEYAWRIYVRVTYKIYCYFTCK